jgi:UDP-2-acetamido-3-amino-2,3-dideoxy-glucuronate N-acetyltransferase
VIDASAQVHGSAEVEDGVSVGARTRIRNRAQLRSSATIGADCVVGRDTFIDEGVRIGDGARILDRVLLYRGAVVEDAVFVGPGAIVTNDRFPRATAATGDRPRDPRPSPVLLRRGCTIGAGAVIVAPAQVGSFATVGAGAVVTRDVPGHALVVGSPARRVGWVCACGHRLHDSTGHPAPAEPERYAIDTDLVCATCGRRYGYVPDGETLEQRTGPRQAAPA